MGEDPVLVVRDRAGKINAFLNICRHRGNRLCRAEDGNAATFICAYHGFDEELQAWTSDFRYSDSNHRQFYRRWGQFMDSESWPDP